MTARPRTYPEDVEYAARYTPGMVVQAPSGARYVIAAISPDGLVTTTCGRQHRAGRLTAHPRGMDRALDLSDLDPETW